MNILAVILAAGFIMCFLFYQFMKSHVLSNISRAMQKQDYQQVRQLSEKKLAPGSPVRVAHLSGRVRPASAGPPHGRAAAAGPLLCRIDK